jgi:hypothetical protein
MSVKRPSMRKKKKKSTESRECRYASIITLGLLAVVSSTNSERYAAP